MDFIIWDLLILLIVIIVGVAVWYYTRLYYIKWAKNLITTDFYEKFREKQITNAINNMMTGIISQPTTYSGMWSTDDITIPVSFLSCYVQNQGISEITMMCQSLDKDKLLEQWNKIEGDNNFWSFHIKHGGSMQSYLDKFVLPNMEIRKDLLMQANLPTQNLIKLIDDTIGLIKNTSMYNAN
jgi:hypothetical protein